jgi:hypothetical protein
VNPQTAGPPTRERSTERQRELERSRARTDGGTPATTESTHRAEEGQDGGDEQSRFQSLFIDITGTEEIVERQHYEGSRVLNGEDGTSSVSDYLTDIAQDDGLSETRSNPEPDR